MKKLFFVSILIGCISLFSCIDEIKEKEDDKLVEDETKSEIELKNGMLVFPSHKILADYINTGARITIDNFVSQKNLFDEVVEAEWAWYEKTKSLEEVEKHSPLYYQRLQEGIIQEVFYTDGTQSYKSNLALPFYNKVLNKEGFFAVGDTLYQITPKFMKKWIYGDINNYGFLKTQNVSNEKKGIYIVDYSEQTEDVSKNLQTRALFPIPNLLTLSTGMYCNFENKMRTTVFIKDQIKINNMNSYDRSLYFQISHQFIDGNILRFVSKPYRFTAIFEFVDKDAPTVLMEPINSQIDHTGSCDYFYVWAPSMIVPGQESVTYENIYYYLYSFYFFVMDRRDDIPSYFENRYMFSGKRQNYTSGSMEIDYSVLPYEDYHFVSEMPQP